VLGPHILKECPNSYITDWSRDMIRLFHICHAVSPSLGGPVIIPGPLPSPGGVFDQDNATMEAFAVIRAEMVETAKRPGKKQKRDSSLRSE
jgi:hypothetical protein